MLSTAAMTASSSLNSFHLAPAPKSRVPSTSKEPETPDMLVWSRLPTPVPHDLLSPPPSGASSPRSFNIYTPSSSASKFSLPSPLPSPIEPSSSGSSKTAAFFASPFTSNAPSVLTPPPKPSKKKVNTLVLDNAETPKPDLGTSVRSATADFFATPFNASYRPTPPPSLQSSASSREPSPPRLPPLSRVFPSRYASDPTKLEDFDSETSSHSRDPSYTSRTDSSEWETSFKREFLNLAEKDEEKNAFQSASHSPLSTSPVNDRFIRPHPMPSSSHANFSYQDTALRPASMGKDCTEQGTYAAAKDRASIVARLPAQQQYPIRRETHLVPLTNAGDHPSFLRDVEESEIHPGSVLRSPGSGEEVELCLVRALGEGAFSSVWLAEDIHGTLVNDARFQADEDSIPRSANASPTRERKLGQRRKSESLAKGRSLRRMPGLRPVHSPLSRVKSLLDDGQGHSQNGTDVEDDSSSIGDASAEGSVLLDEWDGEGALSSVVDESTEIDSKKGGRLVAVKMMNRALCDVNDRTRISFVREVEVLRHISHPSIVSYIHSFTTSYFHCLVLEHIGGGELFSLVNSNEQYAKVTESAIRRMWGELCRAVGWMHGVGLIHRDIKLENILLTSNIFAISNAVATLPPLNVPLIKLTDFGLSRFIDTSSPLLSTRCGSESYAAPELVLGSSRSNRSNGSDGATASKKGYYDGRETDAWACGVVLYALATRVLPFDVPPLGSVGSRPGSIKGSIGRSAGRGLAKANKRREMLIRIAQCEYAWPDEVMEDGVIDEDEVEDVQMVSVVGEGLKNVVRRLLVRDPLKRTRLVELWDQEEWMCGEGAPVPPVCSSHAQQVSQSGFADAPDGMLVDEDHIDRVAREEEEES